jgi:hypothetical protein
MPVVRQSQGPSLVPGTTRTIGMWLQMKRPNHTQPEGLITVLLDRNAPFGDRDDAAMDLAAYETPEAENADSGQEHAPAMLTGGL